jgi:hypothetical protein
MEAKLLQIAASLRTRFVLVISAEVGGLPSEPLWSAAILD